MGITRYIGFKVLAMLRYSRMWKQCDSPDWGTEGASEGTLVHVQNQQSIPVWQHC